MRPFVGSQNGQVWQAYFAVVVCGSVQVSIAFANALVFPKWGIDMNLWMAPARMILCVRFAENATIFRGEQKLTDTIDLATPSAQQDTNLMRSVRTVTITVRLLSIT